MLDLICENPSIVTLFSYWNEKRLLRCPARLLSPVAPFRWVSLKEKGNKTNTITASTRGPLGLLRHTRRASEGVFKDAGSQRAALLKKLSF